MIKHKKKIRVLSTIKLKAEKNQIYQFDNHRIKSNKFEFHNRLVKFIEGDMTAVVKKKNLNQFDIIYLLYSFHHILDPIDEKIEFLKSCYKNMKNGAYLCIAETFIPDQIEYIGDEKLLRQLWDLRGKEGYISTYWRSLKGVGEHDIKLAEEVAEYCYIMEVTAGENVIKRKDEYLIKRTWLNKQAVKQGFKVILDATINNVGDAIILLQKE